MVNEAQHWQRAGRVLMDRREKDRDRDFEVPTGCEWKTGGLWECRLKRAAPTNGYVKYQCLHEAFEEYK